MKITLHLRQALPFASNPPIVEIEPERVLCNDIVLLGETHPHRMRLWVLGNEFGPMGAVWAGNEQDAIDELIDADLAGGILVSEEDQKTMTPEETEDMARGGNAGELYETEHLWMAEVEFKAERDLAVLLKFAEARGANMKNLDDH